MDYSVSLPHKTCGKYYIPKGEARANTIGAIIKDIIEEKCSACRLDVLTLFSSWERILWVELIVKF